jgi:hypothetical protein
MGVRHKFSITALPICNEVLFPTVSLARYSVGSVASARKCDKNIPFDSIARFALE